MKMFFLLAAATLLPVACDRDETVSAYGAADRTWTLQSLDGAPFPGRATLSFPEPGRLTGRAPCNNFSGPQTAPYPWFDAGPLATTRRACPDLALETTFLAALEAMTLAEVQGNVLILSTEEGREMIFTAAPR